MEATVFLQSFGLVGFAWGLGVDFRQSCKESRARQVMAWMLYRAAILASEDWRCEIERYSWRLYSNVMKAERETVEL